MNKHIGTILRYFEVEWPWAEGLPEHVRKAALALKTTPPHDVVRLTRKGANMIVGGVEGLTLVVDEERKNGEVRVRDYRYPSDEAPYTYWIFQPGEYERIGNAVTERKAA